MVTTPPGDNRIDARLRDAATRGHGALLPYLTAAFPDASCCEEWIKRFDAAGLPAVEIGFPYSDSIADGPVIQDSFNRALAGGFRVSDAFDLAVRVRTEVQIALIAMASYSLVRRMGVAEFARRAAESGFDGLILPDLPIEEAGEALDASTANGLRHIMLVAASTPPDRARRIAQLSTGFIYQVAVSGVTGERDALPPDLSERVAALRAPGKPVCVGFGVGTADQVRQVCRVADGVIVGSAIVRRISQGLDAGRSLASVVDEVAAFVDELVAGTL